MKYKVQISRMTVVCVLCATAASGAFGAASVRSLGSAGTYSGTSAAAASGGTSSAVGAARAGSMRVTPSAGTASATTSSNKATTTTGRVATSPRLSIGKYLGTGTSVSGGSSIKNQKPGSTSVSSGSGDGAINPSVMTELEGRVSHLENYTYEKRDVDEALAEKQNVLASGDDYIVIDEDSDEIYLDVERLEYALSGLQGQDGRDVDIITNGTGIYWQYADDPSSQKLLAEWETLRGPQGEAGEVDADAFNKAVADAVAQVSNNFVTKEELNTTKTELTQEIQNVVMGDVTNVVNTAVTEQLENIKIKNEQVADDAEIARSKLAADVRDSLDAADNALIIEVQPEPSKIQMLGAVNGEKTWLDIAL